MFCRPRLVVLCLMFTWLASACQVNIFGQSIKLAAPEALVTENIATQTSIIPSSTTTAAAKLSPTSKVDAALLQTVCASTALHVRERANPSSSIVGDLLVGDQVLLVTDKNGESYPTLSSDGGAWVQITTSSITGWVNSRYLCDIDQ